MLFVAQFDVVKYFDLLRPVGTGTMVIAIIEALCGLIAFSAVDKDKKHTPIYFPIALLIFMCVTAGALALNKATALDHTQSGALSAVAFGVIILVALYFVRKKSKAPALREEKPAPLEPVVGFGFNRGSKSIVVFPDKFEDGIIASSKTAIEVILDEDDYAGQPEILRPRANLFVEIINHRQHSIRLTAHSVERMEGGAWTEVHARWDEEADEVEGQRAGRTTVEWVAKLPRLIQPNERFRCDIWDIWLGDRGKKIVRCIVTVDGERVVSNEKEIEYGSPQAT